MITLSKFYRLLLLPCLLGLFVTGCGDSQDTFTYTGSAPNNELVGPVVTGLELSPATATIANGTTLEYVAKVLLSDGTSRVQSTDVSFTSSSPTTAQLNASGLASGLSPGSTVLTATFGEFTASATLQVTDAQLTGLTVSPSDALSAPGTKRQYKVEGSFNDGTTQDLTSLASWTSSDPSVTIPNQDIGPDRIGQAQIDTDATVGTESTISATIGAFSAQANLRIGRFAYVANSGDGTISTASIGSTGALTFQAQSAPAGSGVESMDVHPSGRFLYAADLSASTVRAFRINNDGSLTPLGTVQSVDSNPRALVVAPDGQSLYVAGQLSNNVNVFDIGSDGTLTPSTPIVSGGASLGLDVDPTGRYLYVSEFFTSRVRSFDLSTGQEIGNPVLASAALGMGASSVLADPTGRFVYVTNTTDDTVHSFAIGADGALIDLASPVATGIDPFGLAMDFQGEFLYAANGNSDTISRFLTEADGTLALNGQEPAGSTPFSLTIDPSGRFLYVTNSADNQIQAYQIAATGDLRNSTISNVGNLPQGVVTTP